MSQLPRAHWHRIGTCINLSTLLTPRPSVDLRWIGLSGLMPVVEVVAVDTHCTQVMPAAQVCAGGGLAGRQQRLSSSVRYIALLRWLG